MRRAVHRALFVSVLAVGCNDFDRFDVETADPGGVATPSGGDTTGGAAPEPRPAGGSGGAGGTGGDDVSGPPSPDCVRDEDCDPGELCLACDFVAEVGWCLSARSCAGLDPCLPGTTCGNTVFGSFDPETFYCLPESYCPPAP